MHASSICELTNGDLLACCYAGAREGSPDSMVIGSRFDRTKKEWSLPEIWVNVAERAPANPRVFIGPDQSVWLLVGVNYGRWCSGDTYLFSKRSYDEGRTWTDLELIVETKGLLGRNKPLNNGGVWLIPVEWEEEWSAAFLRSTDAGKTWQITGDLGRDAKAHLIQPTVVSVGGENLLAYMRSQEGYIYQSRSVDLGNTWTVPEPTTLPNNNSGIDMVRMRSGFLALAYNPVGLSGNMPALDERWPSRMPVGFELWGGRTPLVVSFSPDGGRTWPRSMVLEEGPREFSYPSIIQGSDGTLHVTYTYNRIGIRHAVIEEREVVELLSQALKEDGLA